jgi:heme/copper-type cytochrome/quinol oxidase subunit 1
MSSGICKNEEEDKKDTSKKSTIFNFWIYFGIIILGILFLILIIFLIYSFFSKKEVNNNNNLTPTYSIQTPTFQTKQLTSFQNIPDFSPISIPPPLPEITTDTISSSKKSFLSSLMSKTKETTDKALTSFVAPLDRQIPMKTSGGFRCMNRRRF